MHKQLKLMVLANVFLSLLYVYTNYTIWTALSEPTAWFYWFHYNALSIDYRKVFIINGQMEGFNGNFDLPNFPFLLFFRAIAVNMYFIYSLQRSKETKQNSS
jgi:hypothetical protein